MSSSPTIDEQLACAARELRMRQNVYQKWVAAGRMTQASADRGIAVMQAIIDTLNAVKKGALK